MKLGMVGTGLIVGEQLQQMEHRPGYTVEAIASTPRSLPRARELAARHAIPACYDDFLEMIVDADIDTVYVGVPNALHLAVTRAALGAGKNVICEKPLAMGLEDAQDASDLARERGLFLWEAMNIPYLPNYETLRSLLPKVGEPKVAACSYIQRSRRYDAFRAGETPSVFDPARGGGALMDLGIYVIHYLAGLFGEPERVSYAANVVRGVDTSGILTLDFGGLVATGVVAKDAEGPSRCLVEGTEGYLLQDSKPSSCGPITCHLRDGGETRHDDNGFAAPERRWDAEFASFERDFETGDLGHCYRMLDLSLAAARVLDEARTSAGIALPDSHG